MNNPEKRLELSITGRVQGVGFRHFTVQTVNKLEGVTGWVKNETDGSVTLIAEGPRSQLEELRNAVQEGPRMARVQSVQGGFEEPKGEFDSFRVRY